jgi:hypothetical protein
MSTYAKSINPRLKTSKMFGGYHDLMRGLASSRSFIRTLRLQADDVASPIPCSIRPPHLPVSRFGPLADI